MFYKLAREKQQSISCLADLARRGSEPSVSLFTEVRLVHLMVLIPETRSESPLCSMMLSDMMNFTLDLRLTFA